MLTVAVHNMKGLIIKWEETLYYSLYFALFLYILIPWGYFDKATYTTSFLPKQIMLLSIGFFAGILALRNLTWKFIGLLVTAVGIGALAYYRIDYLEKHYILQLIYIKLAWIIYQAPDQVKEKVQKLLPFVLIALVCKAFYFRHGNYIHGGYYSSNLFSTFILYALIPEFYYKRVLNIIFATGVLVFIGSKSVYISIIFALAYFILSYIKFFKKILDMLFKNYLRLLGVSVILITAITLSMTQLQHFQDWRQAIEPRRKQITVRNMGRRGLIYRDMKLLMADYDAKQAALMNEFPVSHTVTSLYLRLTQYTAVIYGLFKHYLFHGNIYQIAGEAFGHNPHFSVFDMISRLGLFFLLGMLYFFRAFFRGVNHSYALVMLLPIICFQPFGYTLGHGMLAFITFYSLIPRNQGESLKFTLNPFGNRDKYGESGV